MTDQDLVKSILVGDRKAMKYLILKYQDLVLNTCFKVLRNREDAEDIAQEVFLEAYKSVSLLRNEENISFWLHRVSLNKSINYYKRQNNVLFRSLLNIEALFGLNDVTEPENSPAAIEDLYEELELRERREILEKALDSLPDNQKKAFILHHYEFLAYKDIGSILELSVSSVESLIFRAKKSLMKQCNGYYDNSGIQKIYKRNEI